MIAGFQLKDPDPRLEKKVLLDVVDQMEDFEKTQRKQATLKRVIIGVGTTGLLIAFFLAINGLAHPVLATVVAGIGGSAVGFGLFLDIVHKQWPVTRKYIDMERVRKRIDEIEI